MQYEFAWADTGPRHHRRYDVRLVAGGCLCCVGEMEFGKQLRDILRNFKPDRLLIEPSGAGHAADIVDTLLRSKPDLAGDAERGAFEEIARIQYPGKPYLGSCSRGEVPTQAMQRFTRAPSFSLIQDQDLAAPPESAAFAIGGLTGSETHAWQLGLCAVNWILPRELVFSRVVIEPRLNWLVRRDSRIEIVLDTVPTPEYLERWRNVLRDAANTR